MSEHEREHILQRQAEGISVVKPQGKHLGRPQLNLSTISKQQRQTLEQDYLKWKSKEITGVEFMGMLELKKNSFYKIIKEYESVRVVG